MKRKSLMGTVLLIVLALGAGNPDLAMARDVKPKVAECVDPELPSGKSRSAGVEAIAEPEMPTDPVEADEETSAISIDAMQNMVNCLNSRDFLGVAALSTEGYLARFLGITDPHDAPSVLANIDPMDVISMGNVETYADGSVSVHVVYTGFVGRPTSVISSRWYFVEDAGVLKNHYYAKLPLAKEELPDAVVVEVALGDEGPDMETITVPAETQVLFSITHQSDSFDSEETTEELVVTCVVDAMGTMDEYPAAVRFEAGGWGAMATTGLKPGHYVLLCEMPMVDGKTQSVTIREFEAE